MSSHIFTNWVEISREAYRKNIAFFSSKLKNNAQISVVIKANGYGHGMIEIAGIASECGVNIFCVNSLAEALVLRKAGFVQRIIVLGPIMIHAIDSAVNNKIECVCYNIKNLLEFEKQAEIQKKQAFIHLKIETGTNRQGINGDELVKFLSILKNCKSVMIKGIYSHFANIEDTTDHSYAKYQIETFEKEVSIVREAGFSGFDMHFASSAAAIIFPDTHFNMIRLGIAQYGLWPSKETYLSYITEFGHGPEHILIPVLTWKTVIGQIKNVKAGEFIGYGCSHQMTRDSKIAILPLGYSDGYDRKLSNQGYVLVKGKRAPVIGRIAMNLTTIDITDIPDVALEDEVVLIGTQGDQTIKAETVAQLAGTINYEIVSRIPDHIPRVVV